MSEMSTSFYSLTPFYMKDIKNMANRIVSVCKWRAVTRGTVITSHIGSIL